MAGGDRDWQWGFMGKERSRGSLPGKMGMFRGIHDTMALNTIMDITALEAGQNLLGSNA